MTNTKGSTSLIVLDEEIDRLVFLCSHIAQMATNIRLVHLENISYAPEDVQSSCQTLLTIAENVEGSVILLESLLVIQQRNLLCDEEKKLRRFHYTKEKLLRLRENVSWKLSKDIGILLQQVVERESNDSVEMEWKSWRDIRTILM